MNPHTNEPDILPPDNDIIAPDSISTTPEAVDTLIVLHLRPLPGVDPVIALRQALKRLLRSHGLRCVNLEARGWPGVVPLPSAKKSHAEAE